MSYLRGFLLGFVLLASVCLTLSASVQKPKNLLLGARQPGDRMVHSENVKKPARLMQVVEADRTFSADHGEIFTMVRLFDQNEKGEGATATVNAGGPGFTYVTVHFKSTRGHSIDFGVDIFGKNVTGSLMD